MVNTEYLKVVSVLVIVAIVLALVYINVSTPDNVTYIDEVTTIYKGYNGGAEQ